MTPVKEFMQRHSLSNRDMSELTGVTMRTIINWSQGVKDTPIGVLVLMRAIDSGLVRLDWWLSEAKATKGEESE